MIFGHDDFHDHEQVVFVSDAAAGLRAIIAVHSTALGPAIGGCRVLPYATDHEALTDVLRLSRGMTYKGAIAGVPFGGGKAVVIADPHRGEKTPELMRALGRAIEQLGGRYVTGEDVGTDAGDMLAIRTETRHVMGIPVEQGGSGDPSPSTALGCFVGIEASVAHRLDGRDLRGLRVAVQGLGNVGFNLCSKLADAGAALIVTDTRPEVIHRCVEIFGATAVAPDDIYEVEAEVFSPCALGAIINDDTIARLKVAIVAGGANNQLAALRHGEALRQRQVLYAPDYVINGGGMIQLAVERMGADPSEVETRVRAIYDTLQLIFVKAADKGITTGAAADEIVEERLRGAKRKTA